jgi:hypothetical protein
MRKTELLFISKIMLLYELVSTVACSHGNEYF